MHVHANIDAFRLRVHLFWGLVFKGLAIWNVSVVMGGRLSSETVNNVGSHHLHQVSETV
jgi:hypothetical protein